MKLNGSHLGSPHVFLVAARHLSFSRAADDYLTRKIDLVLCYSDGHPGLQSIHLMDERIALLCSPVTQKPMH